jgi:long-subunit acyl-CoA synthetase (AMP-forming)
MRAKGGRFFVMYGQTEATARIAYVPPDRLSEKPDSIGIAIPGGDLRIAEEAELVYEGPNVMMGYATCREDLKKPDEMHGVLYTGDLGYCDDEGFFYVTGRLRKLMDHLPLLPEYFSVEQVAQDLGIPLDLAIDYLRMHESKGMLHLINISH